MRKGKEESVVEQKHKAFILISIDPSMIKKISQQLLPLDKIENIHELYGRYDLLLKVVTDKRAELDDFAEESIRHLAGIKGTETLVVSATLKETGTKTTGMNEAEAYMLVNTKYGKKRKVAKKFARFSQIESVHELYGQFDIIIKVKELDERKLEDFIQNNIRSIKGIEDTETLVVADVP
jgi:DNA-binding Lrp family transcriptional regulator